MIPLPEFIPLVRAAVPRFRTRPPDPEQQDCIEHPPGEPLMIAAGPGSGKTTVLVLRALRMVFVNGIMPEQVLLTTFTKKAAAEIRSRLIEWGTLLLEELDSRPPIPLPQNFRRWLDAVDVNRFVTGDNAPPTPKLISHSGETCRSITP